MGVIDNPAVHKASLLLEHTRTAEKRSSLSLSNLTGRITEINAALNTPVLSFLSLIVREAQEQEESVVWISASDSIFYPPDFQRNGVDISSLAVVWCPTIKAAVRSVEHLLRSNAFGLVVMDLPPHALIDQGRLGKLAKLADLNTAALVIITQHGGDTPYTLGSIISLRFSGRRTRSGDDRYTCTLQAIKDKVDKPGWKYTREFYAPDSLC